MAVSEKNKKKRELRERELPANDATRVIRVNGGKVAPNNTAELDTRSSGTGTPVSGQSVNQWSTRHTGQWSTGHAGTPSAAIQARRSVVNWSCRHTVSGYTGTPVSGHAGTPVSGHAGTPVSGQSVM